MGISCCLGGKLGEVAETVLLPGDPLRAKYIADNYLKDVICYNEIRGMYGFTGTYKGKRVSVQGTGMGIPSLSIYTYDLIHDHGVKNLIRIGTCGSIQEDVNIRDVILVMGASNDSNITKLEFKGMNFAPTANFGLLKKAYDAAKSKGIEPKVGSVFTSDLFYHDDPELWKTWARFGMLAVEMETAGLYTIAAKNHVNALSILTVSDSIVKQQETTPEERQSSFTQMMEIALELA